MEWLGRYSMTDVMVLALIIFYMNSSGYTEAKVLPGVYCFAASALMTMIAYGWANSRGPIQQGAEQKTGETAGSADRHVRAGTAAGNVTPLPRETTRR